MKKINILALILSLFVLASCGEEKKEEKMEQPKKVTVNTMTLKSESIRESKSFFGTLKFSKSTDFMAQQPGVITKLNVVPGQKVSRGQIIAIFPPMNHQLEVEQAKIQQKKTIQDYNRQKELFEAGAVTKVSVEDLKAQLDIEGKTLSQLQRVNMILAPFNGVITQVHANVGQEIGVDMPIFSMAQTNKMEVDFYVTPKDISDISLKSPVYFFRDGNRIDGKITKKSIQLDERRKGYLITSTFDNNDVLFVGNTVDVMVETGQARESVRIPLDAFRKQRKQHYVFVVENGRAIRREIVLGNRNEEYALVSKGLNNGEELVVAGMDKLKENMEVIINQ